MDLESYVEDHCRYNPENGNLYVDGAPVLSCDSKGYLFITFRKKQIKAHRVCWFLYYGEWPNVIDHINGVRDDNRIINLRNTDTRGNAQNLKRHRDGNLVGATLTRGRWVARIHYKNELLNLGMYSTEEEAHKIYLRAKDLIEYSGDAVYSMHRKAQLPSTGRVYLYPRGNKWSLIVSDTPDGRITVVIDDPSQKEEIKDDLEANGFASKYYKPNKNLDKRFVYTNGHGSWRVQVPTKTKGCIRATFKTREEAVAYRDRIVSEEEL